MLAEGTAGLERLFFQTSVEGLVLDFFLNCVRRVPDHIELGFSFILQALWK